MEKIRKIIDNYRHVAEMNRGHGARADVGHKCEVLGLSYGLVHYLKKINKISVAMSD